jgi:hypothetical protein
MLDQTADTGCLIDFIQYPVSSIISKEGMINAKFE